MIKNYDPKLKFSWLDFIRSVWMFFGKHRLKFTILFSLLVLINFYELVPPMLIGKVVDFFTTYQNGQELTPFYTVVLILAGTLGLSAIIRLSIKKVIGKTQNEISYNLKVEGFQNLLDYPLKWHDKENSGNKIQKIINGAQALKDLFNLLKNEIVRLLTTVVGVFIIFLSVNFKYSLALICYITIFFLVQGFFYKRYVAVIVEMNKAKEGASGKYYEGISNILSIKSLGAKSPIQSKIASAESETQKYSDQLVNIGNTKWQFFQVINAIFYGIFLLMLGLDVANQVLSVGSIMVYWVYLLNVVSNICESTMQIDGLIEIKQSFARMMPIFNDKLSKEKFGNKKFPTDWKQLKIINGNFMHEQEGQQFKITNINFNVDRNQKIGIAGQTGCGKSTLTKILLGLYNLDSGKYLIGDMNFYDLSENSIRDNITIVLQESELFNFSLLENITMMREVNPELLAKVVKISKLEEVISKLPEGMDTLIGEKGYRLSGGERQRVGIARAIYRNTPILIFDEATSNLDVKTELEIQSLLESELNEKTIITIAHRVNTLKNCDQIFVFKEGMIIEHGKYQELKNLKTGEFFKINQSIK